MAQLTLGMVLKVVDVSIESAGSNAVPSAGWCLSLSLDRHDQERDEHQKDADGLGVVLGEDTLAVE